MNRTEVREAPGNSAAVSKMNSGEKFRRLIVARSAALPHKKLFAASENGYRSTGTKRKTGRHMNLAQKNCIPCKGGVPLGVAACLLATRVDEFFPGTATEYRCRGTHAEGHPCAEGV